MQVIIEHEALIAVLDAIRVDAIVGVAPEHLFPQDNAQRRDAIERGKAMLRTRGLLEITPDGVSVLDRTLFMLATVVAFPDIALMIIRHLANYGAQLFLMYSSSGITVEHTFPREGLHRLALISDRRAFQRRLGEILPIRPGDAPEWQRPIEQLQFVSMLGQIDQAQMDAAQNTLVRCGFPVGEADKFAHALANPSMKANVALLRCSSGRIIDARNVAIAQDESTAWLIAQSSPGGMDLVVRRATTSRVQQEVLGYYDELVPSD